MEVRLKISPTYRLPNLTDASVPIRMGDTVKDVMEKVGLNLMSARVYVVSGFMVGKEHELKNGDEVIVLPYVGGG
ncbi:hypothetical protein AAU61_13780 [Desulfocarbo indianensis]|nr:hypothetical protein AAU61_13780 [Desulfocarbo indianensis]